jgi:hypothetical protein
MLLENVSKKINKDNCLLEMLLNVRPDVKCKALKISNKLNTLQSKATPNARGPYIQLKLIMGPLNVCLVFMRFFSVGKSQ